MNKITHKLYPFQAKMFSLFNNPQYKYVVVVCGRRSGKSYCGALCVIDWALKHPGDSILILGPTQTNVRMLSGITL